jgi:hypothetical protein
VEEIGKMELPVLRLRVAGITKEYGGDLKVVDIVLP